MISHTYKMVIKKPYIWGEDGNINTDGDGKIKVTISYLVWNKIKIVANPPSVKYNTPTHTNHMHIQV